MGSSVDATRSVAVLLQVEHGEGRVLLLAVQKGLHQWQSCGVLTAEVQALGTACQAGLPVLPNQGH